MDLGTLIADSHCCKAEANTKLKSIYFPIKNKFFKNFKLTIIKMLTKFGRRINKHSENFNKKVGNIFKVPNRSHRTEE